MRILVAHNYYRQAGGEDQVFSSETAMLEREGHTVIRMARHNDDIKAMGPFAAARAAIWNSATYADVKRIISGNGIDLIHLHNTFPLISPAAYYAARSLGVPVVQSLHNYRLLCPAANLYRAGGVCEDCVGKAVAWRAVVHACYRGSASQSGVAAGMLTIHRAMGTWAKAVDAYIALTEFARNKFIEGGLPADRIFVKPNFIGSDPGLGSGEGGYALYAGRLAAEKGVETLLDAWRQVGSGMQLRIAGGGPLMEQVSRAALEMCNTAVLGPRSHEEVLDLMKGASLLIVPSSWYEGMPVAIVEAFAVGLPVAASNLGGLSQLIEHGFNGVHFRPGDAADLARVVESTMNNAAALSTMRRNARSTFESRYDAAGNYNQLMNVYSEAMRKARNN